MDFKSIKKSFPIFMIMAVFSVSMVFIIYSIINPEKRLPVYNPADVNPRLVDKSVKHVRKNHKISDFSLINQNGENITH